MSEYSAELMKLKIELRQRRLSEATPPNRTPEKIEEFMKWCKKNGISDEKLEVKPSSLGGLGLFAKKDLKEYDLLVEISNSIMLTVDDALNNRRLGMFLDF